MRLETTWFVSNFFSGQTLIASLIYRSTDQPATLSSITELNLIRVLIDQNFLIELVEIDLGVCSFINTTQDQNSFF